MVTGFVSWIILVEMELMAMGACDLRTPSRLAVTNTSCKLAWTGFRLITVINDSVVNETDSNPTEEISNDVQQAFLGTNSNRPWSSAIHPQPHDAPQRIAAPGIGSFVN